ncbi:heavy metal translocating P-type ATPase metal-binding domain-containing protein [Olivibacter sp. SDN3]|uniref:heavy metal translocating P-type ATPase n=1 Tax=Olivibacter sp. SDN3 TaxID=2764720 RepID=UPI001650D6AE|nr:heavy metal translocating P-type ATPase metal-binding domain-containing protein [Olivibacter sp. SDN3]QNL48692.1 heavy metal translocating P-type ATPase metal-binding domain-containing protein [Olivibacter sp. SDN3]
MGTKTLTCADQQCYHCGDKVSDNLYQINQHFFCCLGCQSVYLLLRNNNLTGYYTYNNHPGKKTGEGIADLNYLDEEIIASKLLDFKDDKLSIINLYIPNIHCSSCVWLLENLYRINEHIIVSRADFMKRQVRISFLHTCISLKELVMLLKDIGYPPVITLQDVIKDNKEINQNGLIKKIAVAGFCFGNAMMISFPEYFGMAEFERKYASLFGWINLCFAFPVMLYSGRDYFRSGWFSLRQKQLNLDVPLALGIAILFIRSVIEIVSGSGAGFSDTLCGLVFFLLIGKWVQQKTYHHLSFERDYRSYFPVAVTRISAENHEKAIPLAQLKVGDRILIRNNEIVPADAILLKGGAFIDFSFVTGEAEPVEKVLGEIIYAGGKQTKGAIELEVVKPVSQSYLTSLWNNTEQEEDRVPFNTFSNTVSKYFTLVLLTIAFTSAIYWLLQHNSYLAWGAFTAVLIIACPCALALSSPFTLSAVLSIFDRHSFYLKNTASVEKMAGVNTMVFDKTGTITSINATELSFNGSLTTAEKLLAFAVCRNSNHPISREIVRVLEKELVLPDLPQIRIYKEIPGSGIQAEIDKNTYVIIGNAAFLGLTQAMDKKAQTYISINGVMKGSFYTKRQWRSELGDVLHKMQARYELHLISGDTNRDQEALEILFPKKEYLHFNQSPSDKVNYINDLQKTTKKVAMLGDGLNDAGALRKAHLGIAVSDNINNFSPACDAILEGQSFRKLPQFMRLAKQGMNIIYTSFCISLTYNIIGLYFAVQGTMSPLFAAILMPLSTVSIIGFTSIAAHVCAVKNKL